MMPMIGTSTALRTTWTLRAPSMRIPAAPPSTTAWASANIYASPSSGVPASAWQETTNLPVRQSSAAGGRMKRTPYFLANLGHIKKKEKYRQHKIIYGGNFHQEGWPH